MNVRLKQGHPGPMAEFYANFHWGNSEVSESPLILPRGLHGALH